MCIEKNDLDQLKKDLRQEMLDQHKEQDRKNHHSAEAYTVAGVGVALLLFGLDWFREEAEKGHLFAPSIEGPVLTVITGFVMMWGSLKIAERAKVGAEAKKETHTCCSWGLFTYFKG
jgi:hypothetical protein